MSLRSRLLIAIIGLVVLGIASVSVIQTYSSVALLNETIERQVKNDLDAKRSQLTGRIQDYISQIEKQLIDLTEDPFIQQAAQEFSSSFQSESVSSASNLRNYYTNDFASTYLSNNGESVNATSLYDALSSKAKHFQQGYIKDNSFPLGEKDGLLGRPLNTSYDQAHQTYHPRLRHFLQSFGYYDVFIIDPSNDHVVYSVFKELDYATNLVSGPYQDSGLARAYTQAKRLSKGQTYLTDFAAYLPSYQAPASFISSPIYQNERLVGVLVFQMPIEEINNLMTVDQEWRDRGFGDSGETYLVGQDRTLRNESRFFLEDPSGYFATLEANNLDGVDIIKASGTSIIHQKVESMASLAALQGESGFDIVIDYRGVPVVSSYGPVNYGNHQWAMLSEIDETEAFQSVTSLRKTLITEGIIITLIVAVLAGVVAFFLSKILVRPINILGEKLQEMSTGEADLTVRLDSFNVSEIDHVSDAFNRFVDRLQKIMSNIKSSVDTVAAASTELGASTEETSYASREQNEQTKQISQAIAQTLALVEANQALTIEALENTDSSRDTTKENTERAALAEQNIRQLVEEVTASAATITQLQQEVSSIDEVLSVINSIADQTNLLALNAAIEAARAGEHGRGFAVVADEVRNLASKTQESTVTIQEQISHLTKAAENSVESMNRASVSAQGGIHLVSTVNQTLNELLQNIASLTEVNKSVAESGDKQATEMSRIKNSIESVATSSDELQESSSSIAAAANDLSRIAEMLMSDTKGFKV